MNKFELVRPILVLVFSLLLIEIVLEVRHFLRCYDTPLLGQRDCSVTSQSKNTRESTIQSISYGAIPDWPYRSIIPDWSRDQPKDNESSRVVPELDLIWIASSSHAEHSRLPPSKIFPNRICEVAQTDAVNNCLVVNGSKAGDSIRKNIHTLENAWFVSEVDTAIVYQMAIFLAREQNRVDGLLPSEKVKNPTFKEKFTRAFQRSSLYSHLSEYIGSTVKLSSFRNTELDGVERRWDQLLKDFLDACDKLDITPVLTTFAAAYDATNISKAPVSLLRTLVRENNTLSPTAYVDTIEELNSRVKKIGLERNVLVIDIATQLGGRSEFFVDMVHFNTRGHELVADLIAKQLISIDFGGSVGDEL